MELFKENKISAFCNTGKLFTAVGVLSFIIFGLTFNNLYCMVSSLFCLILTVVFIILDFIKTESYEYMHKLELWANKQYKNCETVEDYENLKTELLIRVASVRQYTSSKMEMFARIIRDIDVIINYKNGERN